MYKYRSLVFSAGSEFRKLNTKVSGKIVVILGLTFLLAINVSSLITFKCLIHYFPT